MDRGKRRGTAKEGKGKEKRREQGKGKNNSGKRKGGFGGMSNASRGGMNRFLAAVDTVGNGVHKKLDAINGKGDARWHLEQWDCTRHTLLLQSLDPLYRNAFKR